MVFSIISVAWSTTIWCEMKSLCVVRPLINMLVFFGMISTATQPDFDSNNKPIEIDLNYTQFILISSLLFLSLFISCRWCLLSNNVDSCAIFLSDKRPIYDLLRSQYLFIYAESIKSRLIWEIKRKMMETQKIAEEIDRKSVFIWIKHNLSRHLIRFLASTHFFCANACNFIWTQNTHIRYHAY